MCGDWGILLRTNVRLGCISRPPGTWPPGEIGELYPKRQQEPMGDENRICAIRRIPQSCGRVSTYVGSGGIKVYSTTSKLDVPTLTEIRTATPEWPWVKQDRRPSLLVKRALLGAHQFWYPGKPCRRYMFETQRGVWPHCLFGRRSWGRSSSIGMKLRNPFSEYLPYDRISSYNRR